MEASFGRFFPLLAPRLASDVDDRFIGTMQGGKNGFLDDALVLVGGSYLCLISVSTGTLVWQEGVVVIRRNSGVIRSRNHRAVNATVTTPHGHSIERMLVFGAMLNAAISSKEPLSMPDALV